MKTRPKKSVLQVLRGVVDGLARHGVPTPSPYWWAEHERFYSHPSARLLIEMVGRGGDKSRESVLQAIAETMGGDFNIPPGERHYFTHISENKDEAAKTLGVLEQYLKLLRVPHARTADTIEVGDMPRGIRVLAARVGAVSGWRCIGWTADENAKWSDEGSDPSAEVIASIKAMTVTHPNARGRMFSSPMMVGDYFHSTWALGDSDIQLAGHAPTWVANPSVSEQRTRELEPHEPTWRREYAAEPGADSSAAFPREDVDAAVREVERPRRADAMLIDSSGGRNDGWSYGLVSIAEENGQRRVLMHDIGAFEGRFGDTLSFAAVVAHVASITRDAGVHDVYGDQFQAFALESEFRKHNLRYGERTWTQPTKIEALITLRRLLRERTLVFQPGEEADRMVRELMTLREKVLPSKYVVVEARRSARGHADHASLALLVARLEGEGELPALRRPGSRVAPVITGIPGRGPYQITYPGVGGVCSDGGPDYLPAGYDDASPSVGQSPHDLVSDRAMATAIASRLRFR